MDFITLILVVITTTSLTLAGIVKLALYLSQKGKTTPYFHIYGPYDLTYTEFLSFHENLEANLKEVQMFLCDNKKDCVLIPESLRPYYILYRYPTAKCHFQDCESHTGKRLFIVYSRQTFQQEGKSK